MIKESIYLISSIYICSSIHAGDNSGAIFYPKLKVFCTVKYDNEIDNVAFGNKNFCIDCEVNNDLIRLLNAKGKPFLGGVQKENIKNCFKNKSLVAAEILINFIQDKKWQVITKYVKNNGLKLDNALFTFSNMKSDMGIDNFVELLINRSKVEVVVNIILNCSKVDKNKKITQKSNTTIGNANEITNPNSSIKNIKNIKNINDINNIKNINNINNIKNINNIHDIEDDIEINNDIEIKESNESVNKSIMSSTGMSNLKTITNNVYHPNKDMPNTFENGLPNMPSLDINITPTSSVQVGSTPKGLKKGHKAGSGSNPSNTSKGCCLCESRVSSGR